MQTLKIFLLQNPTVQWGESPIQLHRRNARNLLFYLACTETADRASLYALFWPGMEDPDARNQLRTTLSKLRSDLPDRTLLYATPEIARLDPERVWVDVREFQQIAARHLHPALQIPNQRPLPEALAQQLRRAANLYSGNQFWPGADFLGQSDLEDWLRDLRQELDDDLQRILQRLAFNAAANGDFDRALIRARRALQCDPFNDDMHAAVFNWLVESGQHAMAVEHCQEMCALYKRENIPMPETLESLCETARWMNATLQPVEPDPWPRALVNTGFYISRPPLLNALRQAAQKGGRLLLEGEAGVGKTRLIYEAFRTLEPSPRLIFAAGHVYEKHLPYQAIINTLRHQVLQAEWLALDRVWAAHLARLLPELTTLRPDIATVSNISAGETTLSEAVLQLMLVVAKNRRLLLILDNAHWHDQASLNALTYIINRGFFNQHGLLVLAYRPEELTPEFQKFLSALPSGTADRRIRLEPFSPEEVDQFTRRMVGQSPTPQTISLLLRETGGNPLFLQESLYLLLDRVPLDLNQMVEQLPLGKTLQSLAYERLQRLSPATRQVVGVAAVIGNEFIPKLIEIAGNLPPEVVVEALEELEQARLIQPGKNTSHPQIYTFVYARLREAILLEMGSARQRMIHLRVARAIESQHDPQFGLLFANLAEHYESAGEYSIALRYWIKAGEYAASLSSPVEAHAAYAYAERLLQLVRPPAPDETVYQLYQDWSRVAFANRDAPRLKEIFSRMLEIGEQRLSPLLNGAALSGLAQAALFVSDLALATQYCDRAAFYLEQAGDRYELMELSNRRGDCQILLNRYTEAEQFYHNTLALCADDESPRLLESRAHAEFRLAATYHLTGWPRRTREMAHNCLKTSLKLRSAASAMDAHAMLIVSEYYLGRMDEALNHARQGMAIAESLHSERPSAILLLMQARVELASGWLDLGWQHAVRAEELGQQHNLSQVRNWAASHKGQTLRLLGQYAAASTHYQAGLAISLLPYDRLESQFRLALSLAGESKLPEALDLLNATLRKSRETNLELVSLLTETALLMTLLQDGQVEAVQAALPDYLQHASQRGIAEVDTGAHYIQAILAHRQGDATAAHNYTLQVIESAVQSGNVWWEVLGWLHLWQLGAFNEANRPRVDDLLGVIAEHGNNLPELAAFVRAYINRVKGQLGYT